MCYTPSVEKRNSHRAQFYGKINEIRLLNRKLRAGGQWGGRDKDPLEADEAFTYDLRPERRAEDELESAAEMSYAYSTGGTLSHSREFCSAVCICVGWVTSWCDRDEHFDRAFQNTACQGIPLALRGK